MNSIKEHTQQKNMRLLRICAAEILADSYISIFNSHNFFIEINFLD